MGLQFGEHVQIWNVQQGTITMRINRAAFFLK